MKMIQTDHVLKVVLKETVKQRCLWKKPLLAQAQQWDLPTKQCSLGLPEPEGPPEPAGKHTSPAIP